MENTKECSDIELINQANAHFREEQLLQAARLLRRVKAPESHLTETHQKWLRIAQVLESAVENLLAPPDGEWKKQGESHGKYDTSIYYKIEAGARLTCRIETPIPKNLLVPLLSVLNESALYNTWIPSWTRPVKLGIRDSKQILHDRKGHQVIMLQCDVPWPMASREVLMDVVAVDDIGENGCIIAKMQTLGLGNADNDADLLPDGFLIPPPEAGSQRVDFDGAVLFRACPTNHSNYKSSQTKHSGDLLLLQYTLYFDPQMAVVPQSLINFVTRVVIGMVWNMLLQVAEQVRDGERKEHLKVIQRKADFYQWLEDRCQVLLQRDVNSNNKTDTATASNQLDGVETEWTMNDVMKLTL